MSANPFSEPGDQDATIVRPSPGGRRAAFRGRPPADTDAGPATLGADLVGPQSNPLLAAAAPLLHLLAHLRNSLAPPDPGDMRDRTARELRQFERRAREAGVPAEQSRLAHYTLCASLDDAVLNTPWGSAGTWSASPLTRAFHQEDGDGFLSRFREISRHPARYLPVLELMHLCLSLGFMGPCRAAPDGKARLEQARQQAHAAIAGQLGPAAPALSPHWRGVVAPYRPARVRVPVWVGGSAALAAVAALFVWTLSGLNAGSDALHRRMLAAAPAAMPRLVRAPVVQPLPPPPELPPGPAERLSAALAPAIDGGALAVLGAPSATTLRLSARTLFPPAAATLLPGAQTLLDRIGRALQEEPGPIRVVGYTDDQPSRTVKFPSNFALSAARAAAVRAALAPTLGDPGRIASEGRADADPVAPNATPEGRERNRRMDIVLQRQP